jgi:YD repeat-containing protein
MNGNNDFTIYSGGKGIGDGRDSGPGPVNGTTGPAAPGGPSGSDGPGSGGPGGSGCGMPVFGVSDPYISLWLKDEPLGYQPALGPRISLSLSYNHREDQIGADKTISSLGRKWNFSWLSYVAQDAATNKIVRLPRGGSISFTNTVDFFTNTRLTGDTTNGFTLSYPDGSKYLYGLIATNSAGAFQRAFLTEESNPVGQKTRFEYYSYNPSNGVACLKDVVDGDGQISTITYTNHTFGTNLISAVTDRFNRSASFRYDASGNLISVTDVAGLKSTFGYDANGWITNMITPYGTTSFKIIDHNSGVVAPNGRSIEITEPDGSKQLFLYTNSAPGVASSYSTNQIPSTYPYTNTLETNSLDVRNTFHWGRLQYANLSTNFLLTDDISKLQSSDYLNADMKHWLLEGSNTVSGVLSMERLPSADGTTEGQKTWYDHAGKTNINYLGTQSSPLIVARVLPDGTSSYWRTDRNSWGSVSNEVNTYSTSSTVYQRTNIYAYATNEIDLITITNALGVQVSSNAYNSYHQVVTNFNALNQLTVYTYNINPQPSQRI